MIGKLLTMVMLLTAIVSLVATGTVQASTDEGNDEVEEEEVEKEIEEEVEEEEVEEETEEEEGICMIEPYCEGGIEVPATEIQQQQQQQDDQHDEKDNDALQELAKKVFPYCDKVSSTFEGVCFDRINGNPEFNSLQCRIDGKILEPLECLDMQLRQ